MATKKRRPDRAELDLISPEPVVDGIDGLDGSANGQLADSDARPDGAKPRGSGRSTKASARAAAVFVLPPLDPDLYINRELSWLEFNRRVLERAWDTGSPLLERVKFASIFCSNLDEFFMIRVAGLERKLGLGIGDPGFDGRTPAAVFALVKRTVQELLEHHAALVNDDLLPSLAAEGIDILAHDDLTEDDRRALSVVFEEEIFPVLTPQAIDRGRPFPHVSGRSLNLIVVLRSPAAGFRFARVKIPATLPRFVRVPTGGGDVTSPSLRFTWLEQLVSAHLPRLFPGNEIVAAYPFHVTRDADIELDDEDDDESALDLLTTMSASLTQRQFGPVVRLMVNGAVPAEVREWLVEHLGTLERDLYVVSAPVGLEDFMELLRLDRPDLKDVPYTPKPLFPTSGPVRGDVNLGPDAALDSGEADIFTRLREGDILVHHPYQSFSAVTDFIRAASLDQDVVAIKQTLYRLGKDSPLPKALMDARDDDTQIAVLVEVKARFDEENNISWAKQLERQGVHVAYGLAGLKTHCKATLVVRREKDRLRRYVHLATGNYNASTARIYEDFGLFTARDDIGNDVSELFNVLTGFAHQDRYRKIWVAPSGLRQEVIDAIAAEVAAHRRTGSGHLIFKMNSLQDPELIRAIYGAAREGVKVDLIIRGICCLRPGVPEWSESIRVVSVVGRFLEHSRVFWFSRAGEEPARLYMGSADLMQRNLDRRVEVVFPIEDPVLQARVREEILDAYLRDTVNARQLHADGTWRRVEPAPGAEPFDVQAWLMRRY